MDYYKGTIPIIDTDTPEGRAYAMPSKLHGAHIGYGYVPRDYNVYPEEMFDSPDSMFTIPENEWDARFDEQEQLKSSLEHLYLSGPGGSPVFVNLDQDGDGYCLPPGSLIRMADGSQKRIEDVRLLDEVLTAEGNISKVEQLHVRDYQGELAVVKLWGHGHLRLTPNHSILTKRGYIPSGELQANDWVCIPKFSPQSRTIIQTSEHVSGVKRRLKRLTNGDEQWETRMPLASAKGHIKIPDFIQMNPNIGRIFGLWIAEGHIDKSTGSVIWSFDVNEEETLASELVKLIRQEWGLQARMRPGPGPNVVQVVLQGVLWCQLFKSLCGQLADGKRIHADLMSGPKEFLEGLFWGWMDGDGCTQIANKKKGYNHKYKIGATVSHHLAVNLYDIANSLGLHPVIIRENPTSNRHAKLRKIVWKVKVNPSPSEYRPNYRLETEESQTWRRVCRIDKEDYAGKVYNIGVEGDNSYVAESISVHNCWIYSNGSAMMLCRETQNQPRVRLNPHSAGAIIKGGRDEGGWCGLGARFVMANGMAPEGTGPGKWPLHSRSLSNDTPAMRASMAKYKMGECFMDLTKRDYDHSLTRRQLATCGFMSIPCPSDFNWWSHSVCQVRWVRIEAGSWGPLILNSWKGWGRHGLGVLRGSQATANGALAYRTAIAS